VSSVTCRHNSAAPVGSLLYAVRQYGMQADIMWQTIFVRYNKGPTPKFCFALYRQTALHYPPSSTACLNKYLEILNETQSLKSWHSLSQTRNIPVLYQARRFRAVFTRAYHKISSDRQTTCPLVQDRSLMQCVVTCYPFDGGVLLFSRWTPKLEAIGDHCLLHIFAITVHKWRQRPASTIRRRAMPLRYGTPHTPLQQGRSMLESPKNAGTLIESNPVQQNLDWQ